MPGRLCVDRGKRAEGEDGNKEAEFFETTSYEKRGASRACYLHSACGLGGWLVGVSCSSKWCAVEPSNMCGGVVDVGTKYEREAKEGLVGYRNLLVRLTSGEDE